MSASLQDRPGVRPDTFSASLIETPGLQHNLTVNGEATGDYRVQEVHLVRAHHQGTAGILVLDVTAKLGPVQNPHPEIERVFQLRYTEQPAHHRYSKIKIVNGNQHFMINVVDVL